MLVGPALDERCAFVQGLGSDLLVDEQEDDERVGVGVVVVAGGAQDHRE